MEVFLVLLYFSLYVQSVYVFSEMLKNLCDVLKWGKLTTLGMQTTG